MNQVFAAVKGLIENNGKYLLIRQKVGNEFIYDLPGGKIEYGESPYDTLRREIKEEVNLDVEIQKPLGMWWFFRHKDGNQVVCTAFLCQSANANFDITKNPVKTENIDLAVWVSKKELAEKITNKSLLNLINEI